MRSEEDCPRSQRFLFCDTYLSDAGIELSQKNTAKRFESREKNDLYQNYITWKRENNEILVFTLYAYADLKLNKAFDCIFNYDNPDEFVFEKFTLLQSIYEGWAPIDTVEDGHKHLLLFRFENEIPEILFKLHREDTTRGTRPEIHAKLGFCCEEDFKYISNRIKKNNILRKK